MTSLKKTHKVINHRTIHLLIAILFWGSALQAQNQAGITLNGPWKLSYGLYDANAPHSPVQLKTKNWPEVPATVPGNVELDLLAAGKIENPEIGNHVYDLRKFEAYQWWYSRTFDTPKTAQGDRVELVFEGIDCLGTIWVNDSLVGKAENMFIDYRFDVTKYLKPGGINQLSVQIDPVVPEARKYFNSEVSARKYFRVEQANFRKAPHMYGWDIMPRLISAGLWRDVNLDIKHPTHIKDVFWMTDEVNVANKTAQLLVDWQVVSNYATIDGLKMEVSLAREGKTIYAQTFPVYNHCSRQTIPLENVDFWWPRGYGNPTLYNASVRLLDSKKQVLDEKQQKIGIRTVDLIFSDGSGKDPGEFVFKVNGEKIFIKGTNWVPLDALHSRDKNHLDEAFKMIVDLNCNMIRCWGGNVYEDHAFFDLCDKNGVMVWQDFSMAGTVYPQDDSFADKIRKEAVNVIIKLRDHPSLALWSGNNEIDISLGWNFKKPLDPSLERISREILPRAIWEYDPLRPYLPSSPYITTECFRHGNDPAMMPEVHLWGPRGYYKTPFYTSDVKAHFVSEIGYHGCPNRSSLEKMFDPAYVYPWTSDGKWNDEWQTKAARANPEGTITLERNDLMIKQVKALFGECPKDLDQFIFGSQVVQAEAMKYFIELWRMDKFDKTGIIWWNLRDGWPIISDAVVDYYNSKKLAYYYIKQVQTDACVMIGDAKNGQHPVMAVNDTREEKSGTVTVKDSDSGKILFSGTFKIPVNGKTLIGYIPEEQKQSMWLIDYTINNDKFKNHYLEGKAPFNMKDYMRWAGKINIKESGKTN
jgi:beta-mannosidase